MEYWKEQVERQENNSPLRMLQGNSWDNGISHSGHKELSPVGNNLSGIDSSDLCQQTKLSGSVKVHERICFSHFKWKQERTINTKDSFYFKICLSLKYFVAYKMNIKIQKREEKERKGKKKWRILWIKGAVCVSYFSELAKIQNLRLLQSCSSNLREYRWIKTNMRFKYGAVVLCLQFSPWLTEVWGLMLCSDSFPVSW